MDIELEESPPEVSVTYLDEVLPEIEITELRSLDEVLAEEPSFVAFRPEEIQKKLRSLVRGITGPTLSGLVSLHQEILSSGPLRPQPDNRYTIPILDAERPSYHEYEDLISFLELHTDIYENPGYQARMALLDALHVPVAPAEEPPAPDAAHAFSTEGLGRAPREVALQVRKDRTILKGTDDLRLSQLGSFFQVPATVPSHTLGQSVSAMMDPERRSLSVAGELDAQPTWQEVVEGIPTRTDLVSLLAYLEQRGHGLEEGAATPEEIATLVLHLESLPAMMEPSDAGEEAGSTLVRRTGPAPNPVNLWTTLANLSVLDLSRYKEYYQALLERMPARPNGPEIPATMGVLEIAQGIRQGRFTVEEVIQSLRYVRANHAFLRAKATMEAYMRTQEGQEGLPARIQAKQEKWDYLTGHSLPVPLPLLDVSLPPGQVLKMPGIRTEAAEIQQGASTQGYEGNPLLQTYQVYEELEYEGFAQELPDELDTAYDEAMELHREGIQKRYLHLQRASALPALSRPIVPEDTLPGLLAEWAAELLEASVAGGLVFDTSVGYVPALYRWSPYGPPATSEKEAEGRGILYYLAEVATGIGVFQGAAESLFRQALKEIPAARASRLQAAWSQKKEALSKVSLGQGARQAELSFAEAIQRQRGIPAAFVRSLLYLPGILGQPLTHSFGCCLQQLGPGFQADTDLSSKKRLFQVKEGLGKRRVATEPRPHLYSLTAPAAAPAPPTVAPPTPAPAAPAAPAVPAPVAPRYRDWVSGIAGLPAELRTNSRAAYTAAVGRLEKLLRPKALVEAVLQLPVHQIQRLLSRVMVVYRPEDVAPFQEALGHLRGIPGMLDEKEVSDYQNIAIWLLEGCLSMVPNRKRSDVIGAITKWTDSHRLLTMAEYQDYISKKREDKKMEELQYLDARPEERRLLSEAKKLQLWSFTAPEEQALRLDPAAQIQERIAAGGEDEYDLEGAAEHAMRGQDESDEEY